MVENLTRTKELIAQHGCAVLNIGAGEAPDEPAFSYTVGLTALGHPEVMITGMPFEPAQAFLNLVGDAVHGGRRFRAGTLTGDLTDGHAVAIQVARTDELTAVEQIYGRVDALQLVWPDSAGRLPWDEGYNNPPHVQPFRGPVPQTWERDDAPGQA